MVFEDLSKVPNIFQEKIAKVWNSIKQFHQIPISRLNYSLFLALLFHFGQICSIYFLMRAVNINISIVSIAWITAAVCFLQMLPISISGLGVREGAFVFLLKRYGVYASDAMALSLLMFGVLVVFALIGGVFEAIDSLKRYRKEG